MRYFGIVLLPVVFVMLVGEWWRCRSGRHGMTDPNGICVRCGRKISRGRGDRNPEGTMVVTEVL